MMVVQPSGITSFYVFSLIVGYSILRAGRSLRFDVNLDQ